MGSTMNNSGIMTSRSRERERERDADIRGYTTRTKEIGILYRFRAIA